MRRRRVTAAVFATLAMVAGVLVAPISAQAASSVSVPDAVAKILADTNALRAASGLAPLAESTAIDTVAQNWSAQMYANGALTHNPSYSTQIPSGWTGAAENIATGYTYTTVVEAWHQSAEHYANIMGDYNTIGIGYYEANGQTYFTEDFGKYTTVPSPANVTTPTPTATPTPTPTATSTPSPSPSPTSSSSPPPSVAVSSASTAPTPVVSGNRILDSRSGAAWIPHAVNWPSFEYACQQGWAESASGATAAAAAAMVSWGINAVRIPLNQDCWLGVDGAPAYGTSASYKTALGAWVNILNQAGLVVILDLHWTAPTGFAADGQRAMPDAQSLTFWTQAAAYFKNSRSVLFETFNEPYSRGAYTVSWACWKNGGCQVPSSNDQSAIGSSTYTAVGQAQVVAAIRATGATQPILLDGLNYANDLTGWLVNKPSDSQLIASWHNYPGQGCDTSSCWNSQILPVAASVPVIATEFGETDGGSTFITNFMNWADGVGIGYAPWAWWVTGSSDSTDANLYSLISNLTTFAPRAPEGTAYQQHLAALMPAAPVVVPVNSLVKAPSSGAIYFIDGQSRKIPLSSFDIAAQFGQTNYLTISDGQLAQYTTASSNLSVFVTCSTGSYVAAGGTLVPVGAGQLTGLAVTALSDASCAALPKSSTPITGRMFFLSDGTIWAIDSGTRRAATTFTSLAAFNNGVIPAYISMPFVAIAGIPAGKLLIGPNTLVKGPSSATIYYIDGDNRKIPVSSFDIAGQFGSLSYLTIPDSQLATYASDSNVLSIFVSCGTSTYIASGGQLLPVDRTLLANLPGSNGMITALSSGSCAALNVSTAPAITGALFVRTSDGSIWLIQKGVRRAATTFASLSAYNGGVIPSWVNVPFVGIANIPAGQLLIGPGTLVKSPSSATIYYIDGDTRKIPVNSFDIAAQFGSLSYLTISDAALAVYTTSSSILSIFVSCGTSSYVASGGQLLAVDPAAIAGLPTTTLGTGSCAALAKSTAAPMTKLFFLSDGTIWAIDGGTRRAATSWSALIAYNGGTAPQYISTPFVSIASIPAGSLITDPIPTPPAGATPTPIVNSTASLLALPRVPWYGGPAYYAKFPKAAAAGWTSSSFFPISVFLGKPSHAAALKSIGINTYMGAEHDGSNISTITSQGISVIAQSEWTPAEIGNNPGVVGWHASDECEMGMSGCDSPTEAGRLAQQQAYVSKLRALNDGRFIQANFSNGVLGSYWAPTTMDDQVGLVDLSSVDKYGYTSPDADSVIKTSGYWNLPNPASSATYGWLQDRMSSFSNSTKPNWVFVETAMPLLTDSGARTITGDQIEGAVWNSLIHGASGIAYFQHNNNGVCGTYSLVDCSQALRDKVKKVDSDVQSLAPVLNTQSYVWNFGAHLQTALKAANGSAYIFAMTDGATGAQTFTLPTGVTGPITVVGENRTISPVGGTFTDTFAAEYSHHIYQIALG